MTDFARLQEDLAYYREALRKSAASQRYKIGQGNTARENERPEFRQLRDYVEKLEADIAVHPDNPARARRVRQLRPMY